MSRNYSLKRSRSAVESGIDYAAELNAQQMEAVTSEPGASLVIAGAGSGKTRTLTYRVAWLIDQGFDPGEILLLTFTNKAAREMLERVSELVPRDLSGLWGGTFHSIGNRILRRHAEAAGFTPGFSIMDREDAESMIKAVVAEAGVAVDKRFPKPSVLSNLFSLAVNTGTCVEQVILERYEYFEHLQEGILEVAGKYTDRKRASNSMDFDDLLILSCGLLRDHADVADRYRRRFRAILVDEYQDTNRVQSEFIDLLAGGHRHLMVVGDDAQSIYSWRGAELRNILEFPKRYPGAKVYRIETNYRSVPQILELANEAIRGNEVRIDKNLRAARGEGAVKPGVVELASSGQQAEFVAQRVLELRDEGVELHDIAVLYRAHYHSMELQMELTRRGIPFRITSGIRFFEQAHIKDATAFLKFVVNPRDETAFLRIARLLPGVGEKTAARVWREVAVALAADPDATRGYPEILEAVSVPPKAKKDWRQLGYTLGEIAPERTPAAPAEMIATVCEAVYEEYLQANYTNYENRLADLETLEGFAGQYDDAEEFLAQLALLTNLENDQTMAGDADEEMLNLTTVHQAKGLEWKVVFVIYLNEGMFPLGRALEDDDGVEEERRLFYVAVTRAENELYLTWPQTRSTGSYDDGFQRPSRFLNELPPHTYENWEVSSGYEDW